MAISPDGRLLDAAEPEKQEKPAHNAYGGEDTPFARLAEDMVFWVKPFDTKHTCQGIEYGNVEEAMDCVFKIVFDKLKDEAIWNKVLFHKIGDAAMFTLCIFYGFIFLAATLTAFLMTYPPGTKDAPKLPVYQQQQNPMIPQQSPNVIMHVQQPSQGYIQQPPAQLSQAQMAQQDQTGVNPAEEGAQKPSKSASVKKFFRSATNSAKSLIKSDKPTPTDADVDANNDESKAQVQEQEQVEKSTGASPEEPEQMKTNPDAGLESPESQPSAMN